MAAVRSAVNCDVQGGRGDALARALRSLALRLAAMSVVPDVRAATGTLRPRARQPRCMPRCWQRCAIISMRYTYIDMVAEVFEVCTRAPAAPAPPPLIMLVSIGTNLDNLPRYYS